MADETEKWKSPDGKAISAYYGDHFGDKTTGLDPKVTDATYPAEKVKAMLGASMDKFRSSMIGLMRECAGNQRYKNMTGEQALIAVADKLEQMSHKTPAAEKD